MEGVLVRNYRDVQGELEEFLVPHLRSGRVASDQTVVDGFEGTLDGFIGMLGGPNTGKLLIHVAD